MSVCLCAVMPARVCVGLCQEMAELSGTRCLLNSLAVGVSVMRATEACLCGRVFLCILRMHMYCTKCAYLKHTIYIFSLQCFPVVTKGGYSGYSPNGSKRRPKAQNLHKNTHKHSTICTHTHTKLRRMQHTCVVALHLINHEYSGYFCIVQGVCQGEANCAKNM